MSGTQTINEQAAQVPSAATVDLKLEVVVIPVSDVDRAKRFTEASGGDSTPTLRFPAASASSVHAARLGVLDPVRHEHDVGRAWLGAKPVSRRLGDRGRAGNDLAAPRRRGELRVFYPTTPGARFQSDRTSGRVSGPAPDHASYRSFATFRDPDGNSWLLQGDQDAASGEESAASMCRR